MSNYQEITQQIVENPKKWLVTGVAGFIGSNLLRTLLSLGQNVVGIDNFETGHRKNLKIVKSECNEQQWKNFNFIKGDIRDFSFCLKSATNIEIVLHQAALGSVPRSLEFPLNTNEVNITGFLNMLEASRESGIERFVYAASSSTYGDHSSLPKVEEEIGRPLSPYAVTKYVNELYADVFHRAYELNTVGLRYFNVFGPLQDPNGAYAAVIPKWISSLLKGLPVYINGDGKTSRDFCFIENAVQANILAGTSTKKEALNTIFNVAVGEQTSLNKLFKIIQQELKNLDNTINLKQAEYRDFREGDVKHSLADITKARSLLGYNPSHKVDEGIKETVKWHYSNL